MHLNCAQGKEKHKMNEIIQFNYESNEIRIVKDEKENPWWVASDICFVLGLSNPTEAVRSLDEDEKSTLRISEGGPERIIINEPGLYNLIIRSNKPEAKQFRRWITHDVLPQIRKTGNYQIQKMSELDLIIKSAEALKKIDNRLIQLEAKTHQNSGETGYWTITAWARLNKLNLSLNEALKKGLEASKLSRSLDVHIGKVHDERFGEVNSYREDILDQVFDHSDEMAVSL
jgi:prophage antirepressor-like protein